MMTLTTQQDVLKRARKGDAEWKKAVVFATYQPCLYLNEESEQKIKKKSIYIDDISLEELSDGIIKMKPRKRNVKKRGKASKTLAKTQGKRIALPKKKRVIRAKKTTAVKRKKPATATISANKAVSKEAQKVGNSSSFTSWLKTTKSSKVKTAKKTSLKSKIKKSTQSNQLLLTEPIADQLAEQGYYKQAIRMYEQLRLIIPEKSSYFAALISKLKKEI